MTFPADDPLPRFLDDAAATKLLQAARADPDPFVRLAVEFLARTGLRKGEFIDLTIDSVVQIGSAYWLRVPLGKLRNDRYIPLHPQLKDLLDDWLAHAPPGCAATTCSSTTDAESPPHGSTAPVAKAARDGRHRPRHPASTQTHPGHPGHQPGHVPRGHRRACWATAPCG